MNLNQPKKNKKCVESIYNKDTDDNCDDTSSV